MFVLVVVQLASALVLYGRVPGVAGPRWIGGLHRWSGRAAVLLSVPVAVHCLYALGLQHDSVRVLVHSLIGCFFYGAFTAKMLVLRAEVPRWVLPVSAAPCSPRSPRCGSPPRSSSPPPGSPSDWL